MLMSLQVGASGVEQLNGSHVFSLQIFKLSGGKGMLTKVYNTCIAVERGQCFAEADLELVRNGLSPAA